MVEKVEKLLFYFIALRGLGEGGFELAFGDGARQGGQGFGFFVDGAEDLFEFVDGELVLFGEVGEHLVYFVVRHSI